MVDTVNLKNSVASSAVFLGVRIGAGSFAVRSRSLERIAPATHPMIQHSAFESWGGR